MKRRKTWGLLAALVSGSIFQLGGCIEGIFDAGIVDNVWLDVLTDWLREDLAG